MRLPAHIDREQAPFRADTAVTQFAVRWDWPQARLTPPMDAPTGAVGHLPQAVIAFSDAAEQVSNARPLYQVLLARPGRWPRLAMAAAPRDRETSR